jgi:hypothetical protein
MIKFPDCLRYGLPVHRHNWYGSQRMIPFIKTPTHFNIIKMFNLNLSLIKFIFFSFYFCFMIKFEIQI